jgi:hypothetical protein
MNLNKFRVNELNKINYKFPYKDGVNEAVYKSPKWLKKYFDFEVHTGEDIKGKISKKEIRNEWGKKWKEIDTTKFIEFYREVIDKNVYKSDLPKIKNKWVGDFELWEKYDIWLSKKKVEESRYAELKKDLDNLFQRIIDDFTNNPYDDKYRTYKNSNSNDVTFHYRFENNDIVEICGNKITHGSQIYTVGIIYKNKFISLANAIIKKGGRKRENRNASSAKKSTNSKYSNHPKGNLYQTLKDTISQRKSQLSKMQRHDPERVSLKNELEAAEKKLKDMNVKYQFENLSNFSKFRY